MAAYSCAEDNIVVQIGTYEYNMEKQRQEVNTRLQARLNQIREKNIHLMCIDKLKTKNNKNQVTDKNEMALMKLEDSIAKLKERADKYDSPVDKHFTKEYRTLEGYCGKYQTDLDKIDVNENVELRARRKKCLKVLEQITQDLPGKAHENGLICTYCEIK